MHDAIDLRMGSPALPPPLPPRPPRFQFPLGALGCCALAAALGLYAPRPERFQIHGLVYYPAVLALALGMPLLIAWIGMKRGTQRPRIFFTAYLLSGFLAIGSFSYMLWARGEAKRVAEEARRIAIEDDRLYQDIRRKMSWGGPAAPGRLGCVDRAFVELAHGNEPDRSEARRLLTAWSTFIEQLKDQSRRHGQLMSEIERRPPLGFTGEETALDLQKHIERLEEFKRVNAGLKEWIDQADRHFEAALGKAGVSPDRKTQAYADFLSDYDSTQAFMLKVRELDHQLAEQALAMVKLLERSWNKWKFDEQQQLVCEDDELLTQYNETADQLGKTRYEILLAIRERRKSVYSY